MDLISGGGGVLGSIFSKYVPLASQNSCPIRDYSLANYRNHHNQPEINYVELLLTIFLPVSFAVKSFRYFHTK